MEVAGCHGPTDPTPQPVDQAAVADVEGDDHVDQVGAIEMGHERDDPDPVRVALVMADRGANGSQLHPARAVAGQQRGQPGRLHVGAKPVEGVVVGPNRTRRGPDRPG